MLSAPFPISFRTSPPKICLDASPAYLSLLPILEPAQSNFGPLTQDFDTISNASMHWSSSSSTPSIAGNWASKTRPTSFGVRNASDSSLSDSVSECTWAEDDTRSHVPFDLDLGVMLDSLEDHPPHSVSPHSSQPWTQFSQAFPTPDTVSAPDSNANTPLEVARFQCGHCNQSFKRDCDRGRHERSIHSATYGRFVFPISGCPRSQGRGYCRADKVKEHLWKKHRDLGYVKGA